MAGLGAVAHQGTKRRQPAVRAKEVALVGGRLDEEEVHRAPPGDGTEELEEVARRQLAEPEDAEAWQQLEGELTLAQPFEQVGPPLGQAREAHPLAHGSP